MMSKVIATIIILSIVLVILATPAAASQTSVNVNASERVDGDFIVTIEIETAVDLDSGQFDLYFDLAALSVTDVDDGNVGGTAIPIADGAVDKDRIRVLFNLPGTTGVSGSGTLATIHFTVTGTSGDTSALAISDGLLVDTDAGRIPSVRIDDEVSV